MPDIQENSAENNSEKILSSVQDGQVVSLDSASSDLPAAAGLDVGLDTDAVQLEPEANDGRELVVEAILTIVQKNFTIEFHPHGDNNRGMRIWVHQEGQTGEEFLTEAQLDCEGIPLDKVMAIASMKAFRTATGNIVSDS